jgi:hypothetical protein
LLSFDEIASQPLAHANLVPYPAPRPVVRVRQSELDYWLQLRPSLYDESRANLIDYREMNSPLTGSQCWRGLTRALIGRTGFVRACAAKGGGIGYRLVHQASMITSWAMAVSMV